MREKLNSNPVYQAAFIGILALLVGFMLLRALSAPKPGTEQPDLGVTPAASATATPATTDPAAAPAAPAVDVDAAPAVEPAPTAGGNGDGSGFVAGPGLPKEIVIAYKHDKVIALLVVRRPAIDDQRLMPMVARLHTRKDTAVFIVKAFDVAKYSRIAQGVKINRTPALVVIDPKNLTEGPLPTATISYGYRGEGSIDQAIRDALYRGEENLPYHP